MDIKEIGEKEANLLLEKFQALFPDITLELKHYGIHLHFDSKEGIEKKSLSILIYCFRNGEFVNNLKFHTDMFGSSLDEQIQTFFEGLVKEIERDATFQYDIGEELYTQDEDDEDRDVTDRIYKRVKIVDRFISYHNFVEVYYRVVDEKGNSFFAEEIHLRCFDEQKLAMILDAFNYPHITGVIPNIRSQILDILKK